jgi:PKD repeat protein
MTSTTSNKASSVTKKASAVVLLLIITIIAGSMFASPALSTAQQQQQQQTTTRTAPTTIAPTTALLTLEEQLEQDRMQRTTAAVTQNLQQGQKQINGIVYTPRWADPVWVQPDALSLLFVYCLPGEYAESGQEILGGSELEVLESYSLAVTADLTGWLMIVENENENARVPAAVGVICASDANDPQTRILSQQEQIEINNIIRQFVTVRNTVINNITQIINIINNVTTNQTGGVTTTPPPTNGTGGGVTPEPLRVQAELEAQDDGNSAPNTAPATYLFEERTFGGTEPYTSHWDFGDGQEANVPGHSNGDQLYHTYEDPGSYTVTLTVTDATGQTASDSISPLTVVPPPTNDTGGGVTPEPLRAQVNLDSTDIPATHRFEASADGGTPPYTYHWDFGDGQEANVQNARHTYEDPGSYTVTLTVTDATGQTASDSTQVIVESEPPTTTGELTATNATAGGQ